MFQNLTFAQMEPFLWEWECNKSFCQPFKVGHVSCVTGRTEEPVEEKLPGRELGTLKSCFWEVFLETLLCSPAVKKKKKPKLLNKFDKTIKAEIDAAEKLRKKVPARSAALWAPCLQDMMSLLLLFASGEAGGGAAGVWEAGAAVSSEPPRSLRESSGTVTVGCRAGSWCSGALMPAMTPQAEDDLAEKQRSNEVLQRAINTYKEASELPDATADLMRAALKRRAARQQFLGMVRTRGTKQNRSASRLIPTQLTYMCVGGASPPSEVTQSSKSGSALFFKGIWIKKVEKQTSCQNLFCTFKLPAGPNGKTQSSFRSFLWSCFVFPLYAFEMLKWMKKHFLNSSEASALSPGKVQPLLH